MESVASVQKKLATPEAKRAVDKVCVQVIVVLHLTLESKQASGKKSRWGKVKVMTKVLKHTFRALAQLQELIRARKRQLEENVSAAPCD